MMMGAFAEKSGKASPMSSGLSGSAGSITDMLTPMLDRNRDGSLVDDVTGMLGRFFGRS